MRDLHNDYQMRALPDLVASYARVLLSTCNGVRMRESVLQRVRLLRLVVWSTIWLSVWLDYEHLLHPYIPHRLFLLLFGRDMHDYSMVHPRLQMQLSPQLKGRGSQSCQS